ncbi:MAG: sigma-70 family RNA polymerase sigma factor [Verrucomicrobia bacterium]|nr:MAG: sigma-70 family RNA polymerase sigma factor [Verrucomicrobiota bacterium]
MTTHVTQPVIPWNLVFRRFRGHELLPKKIHQKLGKLARHLCHFPEGTVHLHILLERHPKKDLYRAALTLRVPSNILRSEKENADPIGAFDDAVRALLRELEGLKAELRRDAAWKRRARRQQLRQLKLAGFAPAPQAEGEGPQSFQDVLRALVEANHRRLLRFVRRQLWHDVSSGEIPAGAIDPRAVVDEVVRQALANPQRKPADQSYLLWLYALARRELARRRREIRQRLAAGESLEDIRPLTEEEARLEGYDPEQPLDLVERLLEPPVAEVRDFVPDDHAASPDAELVRRELLAEMRRAASHWPRLEREVFELSYVEGFEPYEVAMVLGVSEDRVRELMQSVQERLREEVLQQAAL